MGEEPVSGKFSKRKCKLCGVVRPVYKDGRCFGCVAKEGVAVAFKSRRDKPTPTDAPPGSEDKVRVLQCRASAGVELWHPEDLSEQPDTHRTTVKRVRFSRKKLPREEEDE